MNINKKTILFVEDNLLVLTTYRTWLERENFTVEAASDGEMALEKLPRLKPDLVILDLMLPKVNGLEVLRFIREHAELKETPVMILSNAYLDEQTSKVMAAGANGRLLKTQCTPARLIQTVRELLGILSLSNSQPAMIGQPPVNELLAAANEALLKETRGSLLEDAPGEIAIIREHCLTFVKTAGSPASTEHLNKLYQRVRFLCARAGLGDCTKVAHLASALEAILFEIIFKKASPSASVLQTIAQAVDCLGRLLQNEDVRSAESMFKARVLVVDDDPVCNFATVAAMKRAKLEAVSTQDPIAALEMAQSERYDIVLLDINMPGLNGFEVCEKLRVVSGYQKTPVIFVTSNGEFQNRAQAVLSGGNDLIAKPISPLELALKTIMHLIEPREQSRVAKPKPEIKTPPVVAPVAPAALSDTDLVLRNMLSPNKATPETNVPALALVSTELAPVNRIHQSLTNANHESIMKNRTENTQPFDKLVHEVARIIFGEDDSSEMSLRLTRIALERYHVPEILNRVAAANGAVNGAKPPVVPEPFEGVVRVVAGIIFGDEGLSEMHLRLTRIALEHHQVPEIIAHLPETNGRNGNGSSTPHAPAIAIKF